MRISDWSSDVCSSDLFVIGCLGQADARPFCRKRALLDAARAIVSPSLARDCPPLEFLKAGPGQPEPTHVADRPVLDVPPCRRSTLLGPERVLSTVDELFVVGLDVNNEFLAAIGRAHV